MGSNRFRSPCSGQHSWQTRLTPPLLSGSIVVLRCKMINCNAGAYPVWAKEEECIPQHQVTPIEHADASTTGRGGHNAQIRFFFEKCIPSRLRTAHLPIPAILSARDTHCRWKRPCPRTRTTGEAATSGATWWGLCLTGAGSGMEYEIWAPARDWFGHTWLRPGALAPAPSPCTPAAKQKVGRVRLDGVGGSAVAVTTRATNDTENALEVIQLPSGSPGWADPGAHKLLFSGVARKTCSWVVRTSFASPKPNLWPTHRRRPTRPQWAAHGVHAASVVGRKTRFKCKRR